MPKVKVKRFELLEIYQNIPILDSLEGFKFAYAVAKNKQLLKEEITTWEESAKPSDKYMEYDQKRVALCEKHADRDKNNKPVIVADKFIGLLDNDEYQEAWGALKEENKEAIEEFEQKLKEYNEFLKETVEFNFFDIDEELVPEDISVAQTNVIVLMIMKKPAKKEEKPEKKKSKPTPPE